MSNPITPAKRTHSEAASSSPTEMSALQDPDTAIPSIEASAGPANLMLPSTSTGAPGSAISSVPTPGGPAEANPYLREMPDSHRRQIEGIIGYSFRDRSWLWEALQADGSCLSFIGGRPVPDGTEDLAIVGDAVLKLFIRDEWYDNPSRLTRKRGDAIWKSLEQNANLARIGRLHGIDKLVNPSVDQFTGATSDSTVATVMEGILGAVWKDSDRNLDTIRAMLDRLDINADSQVAQDALSVQRALSPDWIAVPLSQVADHPEGPLIRRTVEELFSDSNLATDDTMAKRLNWNDNRPVSFEKFLRITILKPFRNDKGSFLDAIRMSEVLDVDSHGGVRRKEPYIFEPWKVIGPVGPA